MAKSINYESAPPADAVARAIFFLVDTDEDDNTAALRARLSVTSFVEGSDGSSAEETHYFRFGSAALPQDGAADGSSPETPRPLAGFTDAELATFLRSCFRAYAAWRTLAAGDATSQAELDATTVPA